VVGRCGRARSRRGDIADSIGMPIPLPAAYARLAADRGGGGHRYDLQRLGHAKPNVTLAIYAHMFKSDDGKAAAAINAALNSLWLYPSSIRASEHDARWNRATSSVPGCGKTTLLKLIGQLTPRPYSLGSATAASIFRVIDRGKPTLLGDNIDTLFKRKPDLTELFLLAHTRGVKIPRAEKICGDWVTRWFDPFCPKTVTLVGTDLPEALLRLSSNSGG
jgi:hypothetical protein